MILLLTDTSILSFQTTELTLAFIGMDRLTLNCHMKNIRITPEILLSYKQSWMSTTPLTKYL